MGLKVSHTKEAVMARIAIIATLDTKGDQVEYLKQIIEESGLGTMVIDVGIMGKPWFEPTITHDQVAEAAGTSIKEIIALDWELKAMEKMTEGASNIVRELCSRSELHGVLAVGGSMGTSLALPVMKAIPIAIPKLLLSTIAYSPVIPPDLVSPGLMMVLWLGGLWGMNSLSKRSLEMAADAISAAAKGYERRRAITKKKLIAVTGIGWSVNIFMKQLKPGLEGRGYEVAMFHATGASTRALEQAIYEGAVAAVLDLAAGAEILAYSVGTGYSPGEHRLEAAGRTGIPQIVAPGFLEVFFWGADRPLPARYRDRAVPKPHNYLLTQVGATTGQQLAAARLMADKLNMATGPTAVVIPRERSSSPVLDVPQGAMPTTKGAFKPGLGLKAFRKVLKRRLKPEVRVVEVDALESEPLYVEMVLSLFDEMVGVAERP
jgi:uncharacterized protein (UPF0261 family)